MLLPVILILLATLSAALGAYGTHPNFAQYPHGLEIILMEQFYAPLRIQNSSQLSTNGSSLQCFSEQKYVGLTVFEQ